MSFLKRFIWVISLLLFLNVYLNLQAVTKDFTINNCVGLNLGSNAIVHISLGDEESLKITTDQEYLDNIKVNEENGILNIFYLNQNQNQWSVVESSVDNRNVQIDIKLKSLNSISLTQSSKVVIDTDINSDKFSVENYGSASLKIGNINVNSINVNIIGSGTLVIQKVNAKKSADFSVSGSGLLNLLDITTETAKLTSTGSSTLNIRKCVINNLKAVLLGSGTLSIIGKGGRENVNAEGAGRYYGGLFTCEEAEVRALGASNVEVRADNSLSVNIYGNSIVNVDGNPEVKKKNIFGSGSLILQTAAGIQD